MLEKDNKQQSTTKKHFDNIAVNIWYVPHAATAHYNHKFMYILVSDYGHSAGQ